MRNYYDLCRAPNLNEAEIDPQVDFDERGWQQIVDLHRRGQGVILVGAHFGGFDMMTHVLSRRGVPISFLVAQIKPAWLSDFITSLRAARGLNLVMVDTEEEGGGLNLGALKRSIGLLRSGEVLGVLADRNTEQHGVTIRFFGYQTLVASGVAKMALRTRSTVVPGFCYRMPGNRYKMVFDEPIEPEGSGSSETDIKALLTRVFACLEKHISRNTEQWLLLQPVWPS
jgi:KDO2-lipid IV(A) lauroyltransferase